MLILSASRFLVPDLILSASRFLVPALILSASRFLVPDLILSVSRFLVPDLILSASRFLVPDFPLLVLVPFSSSALQHGITFPFHSERNPFLTVPNPTLKHFSSRTNSPAMFSSLAPPPQWGAADAEIEVPSGENTELKRSPFRAWSRSVYSHTN